MKGPELAKLLRDMGFENIKTHMTVLDDADEMMVLARLEAHYFAHECFLAPGELIGRLDRIRHLPAAIVQARYDMVCPIVNADELARAWPSARYVIVSDAGHSVWEPSVRTAVMAELERMKYLLAPA